MIIVTGGAGFIGANLAARLCESEQVAVVDDVAAPDKVANLADLELHDYFPKANFRELICANASLGPIEAVLHQGACSDTMVSDGRYVMDNNFAYSRELAQYCWKRKIPFVYASSAAVYGSGQRFAESPENERPLNLYGYSKLVFDQWIRARLASAPSPTVGLRYFNVYGPREQHKGRMASVAFHCRNQFLDQGKVRLFEGSGGYPAGEQRRDFVYIDDVVDVNLYFSKAGSSASGIYNVGTGASQTFHDVALAVINEIRRGRSAHTLSLENAVDEGLIAYVPFPEGLKDRYQSFTEADLGALRRAGCPVEFQDVDTGVAAYMGWLAGSG